jgi:hypothetical protein
MFVVYKAYDDDTADIIDLSTFKIVWLNKQELVSLGNKHNVLGLSISGNKVNYVNAYNCISFAQENEADEYIRYNGLQYNNKRYLDGYWWVLEKNNQRIHVDYYVCTYRGDEVSYVSEKGYTPYIQAAKKFDREESGKKAVFMTQKSKTGTYWKVQRVVRG